MYQWNEFDEQAMREGASERFIQQVRPRKVKPKGVRLFATWIKENNAPYGKSRIGRTRVR